MHLNVGCNMLLKKEKLIKCELSFVVAFMDTDSRNACLKIQFICVKRDKQKTRERIQLTDVCLFVCLLKKDPH